MRSVQGLVLAYIEEAMVNGTAAVACKASASPWREIKAVLTCLIAGLLRC